MSDLNALILVVLIVGFIFIRKLQNKINELIDHIKKLESKVLKLENK